MRSIVAAGIAAVVFAAPMQAQCADGSAPPCRPALVRLPPPATSIAVLPFENRSPDATDAYLAEGMMDEVANQLARTGRLQVKARTLVAAQWRRTPDALDAARSLNVAWVVHGNVRHTGAQLVVNVELIRVATGEEAWATRFPRKDADVFAVQSEVAESVTVAVSGRLSPASRATLSKRPTANNEAWRQYLIGNSLFARRTPRETRSAVAAYSQATKLDPNFALAWAKLGLATGISLGTGFEGDFDGTLALGRMATNRAIALDSMSAEAWVALGALTYIGGDFAAARPILERAVRLDTLNDEAWNFLGNIYQFMLDTTRAFPPLRRALALNPDRQITWAHIYDLRFNSGQLAMGAAILDTMRMLGPWENLASRQAELRFRLGDGPGALAALEERERLADRRFEEARSRFLIITGDSARARAQLDRYRARADSGEAVQGMRAQLAMSLGLKDEALVALEHATTEGRWFAPWRRLHDPIFVPLRKEPRFQALWEQARPRMPWDNAP